MWLLAAIYAAMFAKGLAVRKAGQALDSRFRR
jgi:hypothetical protein